MATARATLRQEDFEALIRGNAIRLPGLIQNVEICLADIGPDKMIAILERMRDEIADKAAASGPADNKV